MTLLATILYEDQLAVQTKHFGLHELVLRCLGDRFSGLGHDDLRAMFQANPRKGAQNVRKECDDPRKKEKLYRASPVLVAVYDRDKIRDVVASDTNCKASLRDSLRSTSPWGPSLTVVLLEDNTETVLAAILQAQDRGAKLSGKPRPDERDKILQSAAWGVSAIRAEVLQAVPSLRYLVDKLAVEVTAQLLAHRRRSKESHEQL